MSQTRNVEALFAVLSDWPSGELRSADDVLALAKFLASRGVLVPDSLDMLERERLAEVFPEDYPATLSTIARGDLPG